MRERALLIFIIFISVSFLVYGISTISISYQEALIFYEKKGFLHFLIQFSTKLFGQNDYALRLPFVLSHVGSLILLYKIGKFYLKKEQDRLLSIAIFALLPGVNSAALLVNSASIVIFCTLLFVYLFLEKKRTLYSLLLPLFLFIDNSFFILYLSLIVYGLSTKDRYISILNSILFLATLYLYGFQVGGKPRGYFLDTLSVYALIFSPPIFLYFFFTLYKIAFKGKKDILWYISFSALIYSIVISFRQRIYIEDFAPFVVIAVPLMVKSFVKSYRVRLSENKRAHKMLFIFTIVFLTISYLGIFFNYYLYNFYQNPSKHFAYKYHVAKNLASVLKQNSINNISSSDKRLLLRLKFYDIDQGDEYFIYSKKIDNFYKKITISYKTIPLATYYVSKVNN